MQRWGLLLAATAMGLAASAHAQEADVAPTSGSKPAAAIIPTPVANSDVAPYYASHPGLLLWLKDADSRAAAAKLAEVLEHAPIDGLAEGPALASSAADVRSRMGRRRTTR